MISANVSAFSIGKAVGRGGGGSGPFELFYGVIAGGASGGSGAVSGGGGAGGFLTSSATLETETAYAVTVGAGGATQITYGQKGNNGSDSTFSTVTSTGGGAGGSYFAGQGNGQGGSSGGLGYSAVGPKQIGIPGQGFSGGGQVGAPNGTPYYGGHGGGGANGVGGTGTSNAGGGSGGAGLWLALNGTNVKIVGGGGGGGSYGGVAGGSASSGGGRGGGTSLSVNATANTGGGGGGGGGSASQTNFIGGAGGSGFIAISYPSNVTASFSAGVASTTSVVGGYKITQITAAGPSDTVTFGQNYGTLRSIR